VSRCVPGRGPAGAPPHPALPAAHAALALSHHAAGDATAAAMSFAIALGLRGLPLPRGAEADALGAGPGRGDADGGPAPPPPDEAPSVWLSRQYAAARRRCPPDHRAALDGGAAGGLQRWLEVERERRRPGVLRDRPRFFHYYEWMRLRISRQFPDGLPGPVQDKLLALDADELDLLLEHPAAVEDLARLLGSVLEERGAEHLATFRPPALGWEEVKALTGATVGLGLGNAAVTDGGGPPGAGSLPAPGTAPGSLAALPGPGAGAPGGGPLPSALDLEGLD